MEVRRLDALEHGRRAYAEYRWATADESLSLADGHEPLDVDEERPDLVTDRGIVAGEPGLYFVGRPFLYAFNSHTIGGVGRDAAHVVEHIARSQPSPRSRAQSAAWVRSVTPMRSKMRVR